VSEETDPAPYTHPGHCDSCHGCRDSERWGAAMISSFLAACAVLLSASAAPAGFVSDDHGYPVGQNEALLVWALETDVEEERVRVRVNRFADPDYRKPFPLESVFLRRSFTREYRGGTLHLPRYAMVQVAPDGTVADTLLHFLDKGVQAALLASMSAEESAVLSNMAIRGDAIVVVSLPVDRGPTLVSTEEETTVLNQLGLPPVIHSFMMLPNYPRHGPNVAGIAGIGERMVVLDDAGEIIRDIYEPDVIFAEHYLCPAGRFLTFSALTRQSREVRVLDLVAGVEKTIDLPKGRRYYSGNGRYVLVGTGIERPGRVTYYDVSDPFMPVPAAEYNSEYSVETASVCDDGSLVAILEVMSSRHIRVLILDRFLEPLGEYSLDSS